MTNAAAGMPCPVCKVPLVMSERQGVEIDYCPQCRGVWLDRGELDKIIERSVPADQPAVSAPPPQQAQPQPSAPLHQGQARNPWDTGAYTHGGYGHGDPRYYGKKRKHWLSELFDD
jgi:Zn-finger nucleic acid-binding protein